MAQVLKMSYFCVFCPETFRVKEHLKLHLEGHLKQTRKQVTNGLLETEKQWVEDFVCCQRLSGLENMIGHAFVDCVVCKRLEEVKSGLFESSKFQRSLNRLEEHLRYHLVYKAYYCLICASNQEDNFQETFITKGDAIHVLKLEACSEKVFHGLRYNKRSVRRHIVHKHFGQEMTMTSDAYVHKTSDFVGKKSIQAIESLIHSWIVHHKTKYLTIMTVKSNWIIQKLKTDLYQCPENKAIIDQSLKGRSARTVARINILRNKSCFLLIPSQDRQVTQLASQKPYSQMKLQTHKTGIRTSVLKKTKTVSQTRTGLRLHRKVVLKSMNRMKKGKHLPIIDADKILSACLAIKAHESRSKPTSSLISNCTESSRDEYISSDSEEHEMELMESLEERPLVNVLKWRSTQVLNNDNEPAMSTSETDISQAFSELLDTSLR